MSSEEKQGTEIEFGGMTFRGGRIIILLTALSTLGGGSWAAFEFYKDYTDMKEIIQNIDTDAIAARQTIIENKLDDAIDYTRDIRSGLRSDILRVERQADRVENMVRESEERVRKQIEIAEGRFENRRDSLQNDYDQARERLQIQTGRELKDLEDRLNKRLQRALDNPLAN